MLSQLLHLRSLCRTFQCRYLATRVEIFSTPNPLTMKFTVENINPSNPSSSNATNYSINLTGSKGGQMREYLRKDTLSTYKSGAEILPGRLLGVFRELTRVDIAEDFLTCAVEEGAQVEWAAVAREIEAVVEENADVFVGNVERDLDGMEQEWTEMDREIIELLESSVRPNLRLDGGDVVYKGFEPETGMVKLRLVGACVGCPSSTVTLNFMIRNLLVHAFEEVKGVEQVFEEQDAVTPEKSSMWTG